jgi:hypothetical protein
MFAEPALQRAYNEEWAPLDPAPRAFAALSFGSPASTGMLFDAEYLRSCAFFQEFFRPRGFEEVAQRQSLSRNAISRSWVCSAGRSSRLQAQRNSDVEGITPHLGRAAAAPDLRAARRPGRLRSWMIDRLAAGIIVLGSEGGEIHRQ